MEAIRRFRPSSNGEKTRYGALKIEAASIPPFIRSKSKRIEENGKEVKMEGFYPSAMISLLIGAVREQDAEIQDLKSRVSALEAKA